MNQLDISLAYVPINLSVFLEFTNTNIISAWTFLFCHISENAFFCTLHTVKIVKAVFRLSFCSKGNYSNEHKVSNNRDVVFFNGTKNSGRSVRVSTHEGCLSIDC